MNLDSLNESQKKAVTYEGKHLLVLAGAGTVVYTDDGIVAKHLSLCLKVYNRNYTFEI